MSLEGRPALSRAGAAFLSAALWAAIPIAMSCVTYVTVIGHDFTSFDDPVNVTQNPLLGRGTLPAVVYFWQRDYAGLYIPVAYTFFALEAALCSMLDAGASATAGSSLNPSVFHAGNLLLHVFNVALVYWLLLRVFCNAPAAAAGAAAFSLHPLHVESVAWVTEAKGLLAGLFSLLALLGWVALFPRRSQGTAPDGATSHGGGRSRMFGIAVLSTVAFALAMLAKPSAVTLPLVALLLAQTLLGGIHRAAWALAALWVVAAAAITLLTLSVQRETMLAFDVPQGFERLIVAGDALAFYAWKTVVPVGLVPDYGRTPAWVLEQFRVGHAILFIAVAALLAFALGRRTAFWAVCGTLILGLLPVLGLVPFAFQSISTVADRYMYFPLLAVGLAIAMAIVRWPGRLMHVAVWTLILAWSALSMRQVAFWHDDQSLFTRTFALNGRSLLAAKALGNNALSAGNLEDAEAWYRRAIEIDSAAAEAWFGLANVLAARGENDEAINAYHAAIERRPGYTKAQNALAWFLARHGQLGEAEACFLQMVAADRANYMAYCGLAEVASRRGDDEQAAFFYRRAIEVAPKSPEPYTLFAAHLAQRRRWADVVECLETMVEVGVDDATTWFNLGLAYNEQSQYERAIEWLERVLTVDASDFQAQVQLMRAYERLGMRELAIAQMEAWANGASNDALAAARIIAALAKLGLGELCETLVEQRLESIDGQKEAARWLAWELATTDAAEQPGIAELAVRLARSIVATAGEADAEARDILAAALAADGQFEEARQVADEALQLAEDAGRATLAGDIALRLEAYRRKEPFRQRE